MRNAFAKALTETANEALEAITSQASKAFSLQAYWDQALESAGAATYRGLSAAHSAAAAYSQTVAEEEE